VNQKIKRGEESANVFQKLLTGYTCGITASLFCYPMDTLKRRMMTSNIEVLAFKCANDMITKDGFVVFYRGCLVNAMKSAPALAITLTVNDLLLDYLNHRNALICASKKS